MLNLRRLVAPVLVSLGMFSGMSFVALDAAAAPGTCKCNNGCHANPGQCLQGNACSIGYEPTCGFRAADGGAPVCPNLSYISCNGTCACEPVPGYCETIGGAEYCDAGPPDAAVPDGTTPDAAIDSAKPDAITPDVITPDVVTPDAPVPDAPTDTPACVPLECPTGTKTLVVSGHCDPYCAQPCGSAEFKCPGALKCVDGFCIPGSSDGDGGVSSCIQPGAPPCGTCKLCSFGDGTCFDDPACSDGGTVTETGGEDTGEEDTALVFDTALEDTGSVEDTGVAPEAPAGEDGGCNCSSPGNASKTDLALIAAAGAMLTVMFRRRRR